VLERLKDQEWIIVKTYKDTADKYDRYLADIFYLPGERDPQTITLEGRFLNQELLDSRLAAAY
jgi:endonuclease YncB( thermonuclease family)